MLQKTVDVNLTLCTYEIACTSSMSETAKTNNKTAATKRKSDKINDFDKFLNLCKDEYSVQYPTKDLNEEEFKKKCINRWKNMTKKEKEHFNKM